MRTVATAVTTSNAIAITAARTPTRPRDAEAAIDPTFATSMETTSGMTVMRMRLTKIVPTGVAIRSTDAVAAGAADASTRPRAKPPINPARTRLVSLTRGMVPPRADTRVRPYVGVGVRVGATSVSASA